MQITFPYAAAHRALDEFLAETQKPDGGIRWGRTILAPESDDALAVILSAADHRKLQEAAAAWNEHCEPKGDTDLPPGYRPYQHSPEASEDRLLPTEPLHGPLAHALYKKPYDELEQVQQDTVLMVAISCLLRTTLDPDTSGAVPIMMMSHAPDEAEPRTYWQLGYTTGVPGLYLRGTATGFFGTEWQIVTGSGWIIRSGFLSREYAETAVTALGRTLPNLDWMRLDATSLPAATKDALVKVLRHHGQAGTSPSAEEPAPQPEITA